MFRPKFVVLWSLTLLLTIVTNACQPIMRDKSESIASQPIDGKPMHQYSAEETRFVNAIQFHLSNFELDELGITKTTVRILLDQKDADQRIAYLINEVWGEWIRLSIEFNFDPMSTEPIYPEHGLSPFRQLVIKMVQGKQGELTDAQQHALYNYFARTETENAWAGDMDGIIGAVNRESFQWP